MLDTPDNRKLAGEKPIDKDTERKRDDVLKHIQAQNEKIAKLEATDAQLKEKDKKFERVDEAHNA